MKFIHDGITFDVDKPEIDGWEFNEYRCVKYDEKYFDADFVEEWVCKRPSHSEYFIATKVEVEKPKTRKIVRYAIKQDGDGLYYVVVKSLVPLISFLVNDPNFTGLFENEDGSLHTEFISYFYTDSECYMPRPASVIDIESGKVEVRHALYGLFFE